MTHAAPDLAAEVQLAPLAIDYAAYRREVIFQCCKWDPQVGDTSTISDHACILSAAAAAYLARQSEQLARETLEIERALFARPDLFARIGLGGQLKQALLAGDPNADAVRVMRFDFHPTASGGWALSEVNSDVPGGFAEASALGPLAAAYVSGMTHGDAAGALVAAMAQRLAPGARIAFAHATAYADDRQVMQYLSQRFGDAGFNCVLIAPDHVRWTHGRAQSIAQGQAGDIAAIIRFFPAEWLPNLSRQSDWRGHFRAGVLMSNPPLALLSQSKRLPLIWDALGADIPAWRALLPETRDVRDAPWRTDDAWLIKPAFGRVGEGVVWRGCSDAKAWRKARRAAAWSPRDWIAQRRFLPRALASRDGARQLCIGVFTIDGRFAGFYGRVSAGAVMDKYAQDIPILMASEQIGDRHAA